jgi:hypothetical protein
MRTRLGKAGRARALKLYQDKVLAARLSAFLKAR